MAANKLPLILVFTVFVLEAESMTCRGHGKGNHLITGKIMEYSKVIRNLLFDLYDFLFLCSMQFIIFVLRIIID